MGTQRKSGVSRVIVYSPDAKAAIKEIYQYSRRIWGKDQAIAYRGFITATIREYAKKPASAPLDEEFGYYRAWLAG